LSAALKALLNHVLDYAGLFPPARLSLEKSFANYRTYLSGEFHWMLSNFICPLKLLDELAALLKPDDPPLNVSVLLPGETETHASLISQFCQHNHRIIIDTVELKVSEILLEDLQETRNFLSKSSQNILSQCSFVKNIFFEVPLLPDWKPCLEPIVSTMAQDTHSGFKLRTAGEDPALIPNSEQIASLINTCRAAGVKLKFTAGLHHPFPNTDPESGTRMHGFLNVFCAAVLAHAVGMADEQLACLLEDCRPEHFSFSDTGLTWFQYTAPIDKIQKARRNFVTSFGSCSFDEPVNDLNAYGLI